MDRKIGRLTNIRATCTWLQCDGDAEVWVEYAQDSDAPVLPWLPAYGSVNLCEPHGEALERVLEPSGVLRLARLG